jgi:hypothetical protein
MVAGVVEITLGSMIVYVRTRRVALLTACAVLSAACLVRLTGGSTASCGCFGAIPVSSRATTILVGILTLLHGLPLSRVVASNRGDQFHKGQD